MQVTEDRSVASTSVESLSTTVDEPSLQYSARVAPPNGEDGPPPSRAQSAPVDVQIAKTLNYDGSRRRESELDTDEVYLMQLAGTNWTVQLAGSYDESKIASFQQQLALDTRRYRKLRNGKDWYVVVYGNFADRDQANAAVSTLPGSLRRMQPWVRSTAEIQREIRETRALP